MRCPIKKEHNYVMTRCVNQFFQFIIQHWSISQHTLYRQ